MEGICWSDFWRVSDRWLRRLGVRLEGNGCGAIFGLLHICKNMWNVKIFNRKIAKIAKNMIKYYGLFYTYGFNITKTT